MSGVEIVGLVFGVLPLIISALEHYESVKKQSINWWRIKQKHRGVCGRIIDCQLALEVQLQQLLDPLYRDHVVDEAQHDDLLANPGGAGWQRPEVQEALLGYLSMRHSRYMNILQEMEGITTKLCKACKVDDPHFQRLLDDKPLSKLQARANIAFQAKRVKYTFSEKERADLLGDFEYYVKQLERLLSASKILSSTKRGQQSSAGQISKKALTFWKHAQNMYALVQQAWQCNCRSSVCFWLQQTQPKATSMQMHMRFCHGDHSLRMELDTSPRPFRPVRQQGPLVASITMQLGLCQSFSGNPAEDICLGTLVRDENVYEVYPTKQVLMRNASATLADILQPGALVRLSRYQRYNLALAIVVSHLQLHATPWLEQGWAADRICIQAVPGPNASLRPDEPLGPYVSTSVQPPGINPPSQQNSFSQLGILLLELCFTKQLDEHRLWQRAGYAASRDDPIIRHAVACEWLDRDGDVE
ncbi:hypothetical protein LTR10_010611 [Elasticomyces elasticus]|nr:hypothetical protein LTR10_010611 [Elasticomyces elasticus]KAK4968217.1 hypothetical protein LTR42_009500 [Elasticomyces elasticus]